MLETFNGVWQGVLGLWLIGFLLGMFILQYKDLKSIALLSLDMLWLSFINIIFVSGFGILMEKGSHLAGVEKYLFFGIITLVLVRGIVFLKGTIKRSVESRKV